MELMDASPNRRVVRREARAKINLALSVGPPRESDRMHPIASWMARLDLADDLHVTRLEEDRLSRYAILWHAEAPLRTPIDWSITKDLAVRAHLLLEEHAGRSLPVQLKLEKRIPVGAGLGGGSADAAATLHAVNELFDLDLSDEDLAQLAGELGSDIAFCLRNEAAIVEGVGEAITPAPAPSAWVVVVMPEVGCPTARVYGAFDSTAELAALRTEEVRAMAASGRIDSGVLFNDLADAACAVQPRLAELRAQVGAEADRDVHVTGSGSAMFIVCDKGEFEARDLAEDLDERFDDARAVVARIV